MRPQPTIPHVDQLTPQAVVDGLVNVIFRYSASDERAQAQIIMWLTELARHCVAETEVRP